MLPIYYCRKLSAVCSCIYADSDWFICMVLICERRTQTPFLNDCCTIDVVRWLYFMLCQMRAMIHTCDSLMLKWLYTTVLWIIRVVVHKQICLLCRRENPGCAERGFAGCVCHLWETGRHRSGQSHRSESVILNIQLMRNGWAMNVDVTTKKTPLVCYALWHRSTYGLPMYSCTSVRWLSDLNLSPLTKASFIKKSSNTDMMVTCTAFLSIYHVPIWSEYLVKHYGALEVPIGERLRWHHDAFAKRVPNYNKNGA